MEHEEDIRSQLQFFQEENRPLNEWKRAFILDKRATGSVLDVLTGSNPQQEAPIMPSLDPYLQKEKTPNVGYTPASNPDTVIQKGFQDALHTVKNTNNPKGKFGDLIATFPTQPHVI